MKFKSFKLFGLALLLVGLGLVGFLRPGLASGTQAETLVHGVIVITDLPPQSRWGRSEAFAANASPLPAS